ncbi:MAG: YbaB/EbfC family nucleoid-associated protein [Microbacteriaceae bacterium]
MTDAFADLTSARAHVRGQLNQSRERNAAVTVVAEQVSSTTCASRSPRGEVTVTAAADASIRDVTLTPAALDLRPDALAALITATIARAQRGAAEQALAIVDETLGAQSTFATQLREEVESRYADHDDGDLRL